MTLSGDPVLFATNAEDYNPIASKIKAQNPDAVWMAIGIDPSFFGIVKGLRTLGYEGPIAFPVDAPSVVGALGDAATGIVGILSKQVDRPEHGGADEEAAWRWATPTGTCSAWRRTPSTAEACDRGRRQSGSDRGERTSGRR